MALTPEMILDAYTRGLFPMGDPRTGEVEWYLPIVRAVLPLDGFHCPRRLARTIKSGKFEIAIDREFEGVIAACADRPVTWITPPIREAYVRLHRAGHAHSVESWRGGDLVGGLYGVHVGGAFMAESMFHRESDAGKVALVALVERLRKRGFALLDVQQMTNTVRPFGAALLPEKEYQRRLDAAVRLSVPW